MKKIALIMLTVVLGIALMVPAVVMAASVEPAEMNLGAPGDPSNECENAGCTAEYAYKIDATVLANSDFETDEGNTITISNIVWDEDEAISFDWASEWPVYCVIVKAATLSNIYCYGCSAAGPQYSDTNLTTVSSQAISHITFCYDGKDNGNGGPSGNGEVGGIISPANKVTLLAPWIALAIVALAGTVIVVRKIRIQN